MSRASDPRPPIRASAPGKILLAGEYSVLEGGAAIVMAVNARAVAWIAAPRIAPQIAAPQTATPRGTAPPDAPPQIAAPRIAAPPDAARSPFLRAAADALAAELGADSPAARAAAGVVADTDALCSRSGAKLGLGSSAAATVAALAASLAHGSAAPGSLAHGSPAHGSASPSSPAPNSLAHDSLAHGSPAPSSPARGSSPGFPLDRGLLHRLAHRAHASAQAELAARAGLAGGPTRGSGADIAASVWGGLLLLEPAGPDHPPRVTPLALPAGLVFVPVWTGQPADTRSLVAATCALADRDPETYRSRLAAVAAAAAALAAACRAGRADRAVEAVAAGGEAVRQLGLAAKVDLYVDTHGVLAARAAARGGALKPTGAGGGDVALATFDRAESAEEFRADVARLGMEALDLRVDPEGALVESDSA